MRQRNMIRFFLVAVAVVLTFSVQARVAGQTKAAASHGTGLPQSVRLYVFDCGTLHITNTERFGLKKEEVATADLSVPCFLVAHPKLGHWSCAGRCVESCRPSGCPARRAS